MGELQTGFGHGYVCVSAGELYITTKGYNAVEDDELTLVVGETIEVIHKLLDGWWVVRYDSKKTSTF